MRGFFSSAHRVRLLTDDRRRAVRAAYLLLFLAFAGACKTTRGAASVATQLASTATALTNYYTALHTELIDTDQLNNLEQGVLGVPYDSQSRALILDSADEIQKRIDLANNLSIVANSLTQLASSTGAADASAAAGKIASEAASITPLTPISSAPVQAGITAAAQLIVTAIQERKIRQAAHGIEDLLDNYHKLFTAEEPVYQSINGQYVGVAGTLSGWFVKNGQTDRDAYSSLMAKKALAPYGLKAKIDEATEGKIAETAQMFIAQKAAALKAAQIRAGKAMENALADITVQVGDVAANKPLPTGLAPPSLDAVNQWAASLVAQ